jgi:hypothetical protein
MTKTKILTGLFVIVSILAAVFAFILTSNLPLC